MDQRKIDGKTQKRAWFVRIGPFGGMMPWSLMGWLWFAGTLSGILASAFLAQTWADKGDAVHSAMGWCAAAIILFVGLGVALGMSKKL